MPNLSQSIKERLSFLTVIFFLNFISYITKVILDSFFFFAFPLLEENSIEYVGRKAKLIKSMQ